MLVALGALSGCARVYQAKVNAIHNPTAIGGHAYEIVTREPGMAADPNYQQAVILVQNALSGRGMYPAPEGVEPEVVVEIDYDVGPQRMKITEDRGRELHSDPLTRMGVPPIGSRRMQERTPDGRIIHHVEQTEQVLTATPEFEKRVSIAARKVEPGAATGDKRGEELWRVEVAITDENNDLAKALPVLVGAAVDYIGTDTGSTQRIQIAEDAEQVAFAKGTKQ